MRLRANRLPRPRHPPLLILEPNRRVFHKPLPHFLRRLRWRKIQIRRRIARRSSALSPVCQVLDRGWGARRRVVVGCVAAATGFGVGCGLDTVSAPALELVLEFFHHLRHGW